MGTKNNPGKFDCFNAAEPDEPMFVLLARDPSAPFLVRAWAALRAGDLVNAMCEMDNAWAELRKLNKPYDGDKISEARTCAANMQAWRAANR